jgi:hypothetical protein
MMQRLNMLRYYSKAVSLPAMMIATLASCCQERNAGATKPIVVMQSTDMYSVEHFRDMCELNESHVYQGVEECTRQNRTGALLSKFCTMAMPTVALDSCSDLIRVIDGGLELESDAGVWRLVGPI